MKLFLRRLLNPRHLGWVPVLWYALFLLGPLGLVTATSFARRGVYGGINWSFQLENFTRAFDPIYFNILLASFAVASLTTALCALLGFPMALGIATSRREMRPVWILLLGVPFLANLVIRICALQAFAAYDGPLASILRAFSTGFDPFSLSQNGFLVSFGMVTTYLPFMVFPLYGALERFDFSLVEAAEDLGANGLQVLTGVMLPGMRGPLLSGCLLVFIPAMGEFLIPDLLGGAKTMLTGSLISEQFLKARDWPFGSALALMLLGLLILAIVLAYRLEEGRRARP